MRLITCTYRGAQHLGVVSGESVRLPALSEPWPNDMLQFIEGGPDLWRRLAARLGQVPVTCKLDDVRLLAPIPRPRKNIICLGLNYAEHIQEAFGARGHQAQTPEHLVVFTKAPTTVNGPHSDILVDDAVSAEMDWEVELALVIGVGGRGISKDDALKHVFGYTVVNDVSARDIQMNHKQFFLGKSLDGACPMGPWIVTADEVPDPQALNLRSWVNGELKQDSNTRQQIFDIVTTISVLSRGMTLEPGDVIATGTPAGVGFARTPPEYLRPGDVVECAVEGIGRLRNPVRANA